MDTPTFIIGIFIALLFIVPFVYAALRNNGKKKRVVELLRKNGLQLEEQEEFNARVIGIDKSQKVLFFAHFAKEQPQVEIIYLHQLCGCYILGQKTKGEDFDPIGLEVNFKSPAGKQVEFLFTAADDSIQTRHEAIHLVSKWKSKIDSLMTAK